MGKYDQNKMEIRFPMGKYAQTSGNTTNPLGMPFSIKNKLRSKLWKYDFL